MPDIPTTQGRKKFTGGQAARQGFTGAEPYGGATTGRGGGSAGANPGRPGGDVSSKKKQQQGGTTPGSKHATKTSTCFVAGTLVATAKGKKPIEAIKVGDRVLTRPDGNRRAHRSGATSRVDDSGESDDSGSDADFGDSIEIDPKDWREIELTVVRSGGDTARLTLLRPLSWLVSRGARVGRLVHTGFGDESAYGGLARVDAVRPCPRIEVGEGSIVTATLSATTDVLVVVTIAESGETIRATPEHRFRSATRNAWIRTDKLDAGEELVGALRSTVGAVESVCSGGAVFNVEVSGDHSFLVGARGVLVHNECGKVENQGHSDYDQARNAALEWLGSDFKAEQEVLGRFGDIKGQPIGMSTADGKVGFRVEFDERNGAHINVWRGKKKGPHFTFDASEKTVGQITKRFRKRLKKNCR